MRAREFCADGACIADNIKNSCAHVQKPSDTCLTCIANSILPSRGVCSCPVEYCRVLLLILSYVEPTFSLFFVAFNWSLSGRHQCACCHLTYTCRLLVCVGWTCKPGQGKFESAIETSQLRTKDACAQQCALSSECIAFDYIAASKAGSCRLYDVDMPRFGMPDEERRYCIPFGKGVRECAATALVAACAELLSWLCIVCTCHGLLHRACCESSHRFANGFMIMHADSHVCRTKDMCSC